MPGHRVARSDVKNPDVFEKYQCPHCKLLLKDAVQPLCGHWLCECCADELLESIWPKCPRADCQEDLKADPDEGAEYFPDRFVRREIEGLIVSCSNRPEGCQWEGRLVKLDDHRNICSFATMVCQNCRKILPVDQTKSRKLTCPKALMKCPLSEFGCQLHTQQITREELRKHIATHSLEHLELIVDAFATHSLEHLELIVDALRQLKKQTMHRQFDSNATGQDFGRMSNGIQRDCNVELEARPPPKAEANQFPERTAMTGVQCVPACGSRRHPMDEIRERDIGQLQEEVSRSRSRAVQNNVEIATLKDNMTKLEDAMRSKHAEVEDRDFRLSLIENSIHEGTFIWRIPQFSQGMADAQSGRYTSIFSLPFYTGRYGYKMCLRLYILGDGIGKNTHMSLFFVIMKGDFDNILQWPFTSKMTFKLINQTGNRDIIDTFQPDPISSSFQKPKSDMNIASGCPRFVSHTELKSGGFIVDDAVFIKCSTD